MSAKPEQHLKVGDWWYLPQQDKLVKIDDAGEISDTASLDNLCQKALNYFLVNAGRLVTRDELLSDVWGVRDVSDGRISRVIRVLRVALGDDSREPRYIETIPKRGFRFIAPVAEVILTSGNDEPVDNHIEEQHAIQQQERKHHRHWWLLAGTFLSCVLAISGWQYWQQSQLDPQVPFGRFEPLSSMDGLELYPDVSKDGRYLVFSHSLELGGRWVLVVQDLKTLEKKTLKTVEGSSLTGATWSPDGRTLVYQQLQRKKHCEIRKMTLDLTSMTIASDELLVGCNKNNMGARMSWSPDNQFIVYPDWSDAAGNMSLMLLPAAGGKPEQLTTPPQTSIGDYAARFSSDGSQLVFLRDTAGVAGQIWLLNLHDRSSKFLLQLKESYPGNIDWFNQDREILYPSSTNQLSTLVVDTLESQIYAHTDVTPLEVLVTEDNKVLANVGRIWQSNIRKLNNPLKNPKLSNELFDFATRTQGLIEMNPQPGGPTAVMSNRSGSQQVWLHFTDGRQQQISKFSGNFFAKTLEFSPDGEKLLIVTGGELWLLQSDSEPVLLTKPDQQSRLPTWGADSNTIYYLLSIQGRWQLAEHSLLTNKVVLQKNDFDFYKESPDGKYLVRSYMNDETFELVNKSLNKIAILDFLPKQDFIAPQLVLRRKSIYFVKADEQDKYYIHSYDIETGIVSNTGIEQRVFGRRFSVSDDELFIFLDDGQTGDVDLAELKIVGKNL